MDSTDFTREQAERLHETMSRFHLYFRQFERRLADLQFDQADRFFRLVVSAHDLMHSLSVETHYMTCDGGVCRPRRKDAPPIPRAGVVLWMSSDLEKG